MMSSSEVAMSMISATASRSSAGPDDSTNSLGCHRDTACFWSRFSWHIVIALHTHTPTQTANEQTQSATSK